jgi:hypothetical protein
MVETIMIVSRGEEKRRDECRGPGLVWGVARGRNEWKGGGVNDLVDGAC